MESGICVKEIRFVAGFEAAARESAEADVLREAQPKLFPKESQVLLIRTASHLVADERNDQLVRAQKTLQVVANDRRHRAMLKFQLLGEIESLITVIRNAPHLEAHRIISKGLVDHREIAIEQLLNMLEGVI